MHILSLNSGLLGGTIVNLVLAKSFSSFTLFLLLCRVRKHKRITPLLDHLHWLSIAFLINFKVQHLFWNKRNHHTTNPTNKAHSWQYIGHLCWRPYKYGTRNIKNCTTLKRNWSIICSSWHTYDVVNVCEQIVHCVYPVYRHRIFYMVRYWDAVYQTILMWYITRRQHLYGWYLHN